MKQLEEIFQNWSDTLEDSPVILATWKALFIFTIKIISSLLTPFTGTFSRIASVLGYVVLNPSKFALLQNTIYYISLSRINCNFPICHNKASYNL